MIKDLCALMQEFRLDSSDLSEEKLSGFHVITVLSTETIMDNLPKANSEVDLLVPKLGEDKLEEYIIRKRLLAMARGKDIEIKRKARKILEQVYKLKLIP